MKSGKEFKYLRCYTRVPVNEALYSPKLAFSMHLALSTNKSQYTVLNHNSGMLFAKATQNADGTLDAKCLRLPFIFKAKNGYGILAIRTEGDGSPDESSRGSVLFFTTEDFISYREEGLIRLSEKLAVEDMMCAYDEANGLYTIRWKDENGAFYENSYTALEKGAVPLGSSKGEAFEREQADMAIEGAVPGNMLAIPKELGERLYLKFTVPENIKNEAPPVIKARSPEELEQINATAYYSDGTTAAKSIDWDLSNVSWEKGGEYQIEGKIHQDKYPFPLLEGRADPCIGRWNGKYYFIATNDNDDNNSLYIRQADTIPALFTAAEEKILDTKMHSHLVNFLWAPEFHIIEDDLYIFHAGTPTDFYNIQCHVMKLKKGGDPMKAADWEKPVRCMKKDGSLLFETGITLDMTCFFAGGSYYAIWAQRQFKPVDQGSWLYIARLDSKEPWRLAGDPVLLSMPEYGWANNHIFVDEGPYPLIRDGKVFITIASGLIDSAYVVGLLSADIESDLLDTASWKKENYPLLTSRSIEGEFGPGHISFVTDGIGNVWNAYHARPGLDKDRCSGLRRAHFDIDGIPRLDLSEEKDLNPSLEKVSARLIVE